MAKVIDLQGVARGEAHRGNVRCLNPDVYWTEQDVEDVMSDDKTTLISVRVPQGLLERFDALVRERAYRQGQRVTRNSAIVELLESAVQDQERPT